METTKKGGVRLTDHQWLQLAAEYVNKWAELTVNEIERDIARLDSLRILDQTYLRAYWGTITKPIMSGHAHDKVNVPATTVEELDAQRRLLEDYFGVQFGPFSGELKTDVTKRLEWLKQCLAKDFEREIFSIVDRHDIFSPIEQIFLMEWCYSKVEDRFHLKLQPQKPIRTGSGDFVLDYLVTSRDDNSSQFALAIELDGHEFHEKTKEQALQDKRRERAILHAGINERLAVLRFSGAEIFRNCKNCIKEVIAFIEELRRSSDLQK